MCFSAETHLEDVDKAFLHDMLNICYILKGFHVVTWLYFLLKIVSSLLIKYQVKLSLPECPPIII